MKLKDYLVGCAAYGFLSKEVEAYMKVQEITFKTLLTDDSHLDTRLIVRMLQKLEQQLPKPTEEVEATLNEIIIIVNKEVGSDKDYVNGVIGLSLMMTYKTEISPREWGMGIRLDELNEAYFKIDSAYISSKDYDTQVLIDSQKVADMLWEGIYNNETSY